MCVVTVVVSDDFNDPVLKKIGIVTFEDVVEEILAEEILDEKEQLDQRKERKQMREKLLMIFSNNQA